MEIHAYPNLLTHLIKINGIHIGIANEQVQTYLHGLDHRVIYHVPWMH